MPPPARSATNLIRETARDLGGREATAVFEAELSSTFDELFPPWETPPRLREASRMALLAGGHRVRPALCRVVAAATLGTADTDTEDGEPSAALARAYGVALELSHAASLVHDDLPSFDDATTRRGRPSIHAAYGVATAVLVGDGLIVASFEAIARTAALAPERVVTATKLLARALGGARGLVAGQAWESEPSVDLERYHRAKTGALFEAAACLGALASGQVAEDFRSFGQHIGLAYQTADDLLDVATGHPADKTPGRDAIHGRPNAAHTLGETLARAKLARLLEETRLTIPNYADRAPILAWLDDLATKLDRRGG